MSFPKTVSVVVGICAWFGISAGLAERLLYSQLPRTVGGNDLWYGALAGVLFFSILALVVLIPAICGWRKHLDYLAFFLCSALLTLECFCIVWPPHGHKLGQMAWLAGGALFIAVLATALFRLFRSPILFFGRITLPLLIVYAIVYIGGGAWVSRRQERLQAAGLHPRPGAPNILLIVMDAVGANHLSTYGYDRGTTPYLTEMAARGLLFEKAVAPSSWTLPSFASMLTGHLPSEHKAGQYNWKLDGRFPTLAEVLNRNGYRTAAFSGNTLMFNRRVGFARGYSHFEDGSVLQRLLQTSLGQRIQTRLLRSNILEDLAGREDARQISHKALKWIGGGSRPFFVTINYFDAHEPLRPPSAYLRRFSTRESPLPGQYNWPEDIQLSPTDVKHEMDAYDAAISYIDDEMRAFLRQLEAEGWLKNTIVVVTSDHGSEFQEHDFMFHGKALYWNLLHAPLVINWPGHLPAGKRISAPLPLQSLAATLLKMAEIPNPSLPGQPLTDFWTNPVPPQDWPVPISELAAMGPPLFPSHYGAMKSVVTPEWHYVLGGKSGHELYTCCDDEQRNLATTTRGSLVASSFRQLLKDKRAFTSAGLRAALEQVAQTPVTQKSHRQPANELQNGSNNERMDELLRALGYVP